MMTCPFSLVLEPAPEGQLLAYEPPIEHHKSEYNFNMIIIPKL